MRPLKLVMQGFGSYRSAQTIDFTQLDELFVICGETGAGKTTIFDGICYALYGQPLGTRNKASVRCDQCLEDESTLVELTFSVGDETWRVRRSPHMVRDALRGGGTVVESVMELTHIAADGSETAETGSATTLTQKIEEDLLHLGVENFSKVLLLPQGEFQQFLEEPSTKRGEILEKLFPVEFHKRLRDEAKQQAKTRAAEVTRQRDRVQDQRRRVLPEEEDVAQLTSAQVRQLSEARKASLDAALSAAISAEKDAGEKAAEAVRAHEVATALADQFRQRDQAAEELASLHEDDEAYAAMAAELDASRRASRAWPCLTAVDGLDAEIAKQREKHESVIGEHTAAEERLSGLRPAYAALEADELRLTDIAGDLARGEARQAKLEDLAAAQGAMAAAALALSAARGEIRALQEEDASLRKRLVHLLAQRDERDALQPRLTEAVRQAHALDRLAADAANVRSFDEDAAPSRVSALDRDQEELSRLADDLAQSEALRDETRARQGQRAASMLAEALIPGEACLVCGSTEHPNPATPTEADALLTEVLEAQEASVVVKEGLLQKHRELMASREAEFRVREETAQAARARMIDAGFPTVADWSNARELASGAVQTLEANQSAIDASLDKLPDVETRLHALADDLHARQANISGLEGEQNSLKAAHDKLSKSLGDVTDVAAALASLAEAQAKLEAEQKGVRSRILETRRDWDEAKKASDQASATALSIESGVAVLEGERQVAQGLLAEALSANQFPSVAALRAAHRSAADEESLAERARAREELITRLDQKLRDLELAIGESGVPDVDGLEVRRTEAVAAATVATQERTERSLELDEFHEELARLHGFEAEVESARAGAKGFEDLAKALSGTNPKKVTFPNWVLGYWLDRVLARANIRLHHLSEGRYALFRRGENAGSGSAGLGIDVRDSHSDKRRDVRSLSGGEKFLASVSLALGLADVIQAQSGAVRLDTLFIDEGFGTLSDEFRDLVLETLTSLGGSRQVGVISHVPEVRNYIPCRVDVRKSSGGSVVSVSE